MTALRGNPSSASARAKRAAMSGSAATRFDPMPTRWEPCPGKTQATLSVSIMRRSREWRSPTAAGRVATNAVHAPPHDPGRPGEPAPEGDQDHVVAFLELSFFRGFKECNGNG